MLAACAVHHPPGDHASLFQAETDRVRVEFGFPGITAACVMKDWTVVTATSGLADDRQYPDAFYIFLPELMETVFGQLTGNHPLFFLAVYAPAIAAFILVARNDGFTGLRRFLGRALLWRCSMAWYAFLIIGIPLIFIGGSALRGSLPRGRIK